MNSLPWNHEVRLLAQDHLITAREDANVWYEVDKPCSGGRGKEIMCKQPFLCREHS